MMDAGGAPARWLAVHDDLLRGITHALSNRIATVSASSYMFDNGDVKIDHVSEILRAESERMEKLLQQLRLLPERPDALPEPLTANDACAAAVGLHAHHPELGDCPCDITVSGDVYPVWVEPQSFTHALLMALHAAKRNAGNAGRVSIEVSGDIDVVLFFVKTATTNIGPDAMKQRDVEAAAWLLQRHGGTARSVPDGCELQVPTLLAARRAQKGP